MKAVSFVAGLFALMLVAPVAWAQSAGGGGSAGGGSAGGHGGTSSSATAPGAGGIPTPSTAGTGGQVGAPNSAMANPGRLDSATPTDPNLQTSRQPPGTDTTRPGQTGNNGQLAPNSTGTGTTLPLSTDSSRTPANAASSGGRPVLGARGNTLKDCMDTWDAKTHITKQRWREICSRTLTEPHLWVESGPNRSRASEGCPRFDGHIADSAARHGRRDGRARGATDAVASAARRATWRRHAAADLPSQERHWRLSLPELLDWARPASASRADPVREWRRDALPELWAWLWDFPPTVSIIHPYLSLIDLTQRGARPSKAWAPRLRRNPAAVAQA